MQAAIRRDGAGCDVVALLLVGQVEQADACDARRVLQLQLPCHRRAVAAVADLCVAVDAVHGGQDQILHHGALGYSNLTHGGHRTRRASCAAADSAGGGRRHRGQANRAATQVVVGRDAGAGGVGEGAGRQPSIRDRLRLVEAAFGQEEGRRAVALALAVDHVVAADIEHLRQHENDGGDEKQYGHDRDHAALARRVPVALRDGTDRSRHSGLSATGCAARRPCEFASPALPAVLAVAPSGSIRQNAVRSHSWLRRS